MPYPLICHIDTETTGTDSRIHGVTQIAAIMECNGQVLSEFHTFVKPDASCQVDPQALEINGMSIETIHTYPAEHVALTLFQEWLGQFINKFAKSEKAFFAGYNAPFDNNMLRALWLRCGDKYFGSWFYSGTMDAMGDALWHLKDVRRDMPNFKLDTVATMVLGFDRVSELSEEFGWHDARTDIRVTRELFHACKRGAVAESA